MIPAEFVMGGGGSILLGVVGYFLKKTHEKIDSTANAVNQIGKDVETKLDKLEIKLEIETKATKTEITQIFQDICHERQGACGKLRDAMLVSVENKAAAACGKIARVIEDRDKRWERQEQFNEQVKRVLYQTKDGGRSWQLKERNED